MLIKSSWIKTINKCIDVAQTLDAGVLQLDPKQIWHDVDDIYSFFVPPVLIWDPVSNTKKKHPIICPEHGCEIFATKQWMNSDTDNSRHPRKLVDSTGGMLLVGRVYKCPIGNHFLRTTSNSIIQQCYINNGDVNLCHKTAFKSEFVDTLHHYVMNGFSFSQIVKLLKERTEKLLDNQIQKYKQECIVNGKTPELEKIKEISKLWIKILPKRDCLEDLFKAWFRKNKENLIKEMASLPASIVTIDHTFKVKNCFKL